MGLDLKLLPMNPEGTSSYSALDLERNYEVFEAVKELESDRFFAPVNGYESHDHGDCDSAHWGPMTTDAYGEKLRSVPAAELGGCLLSKASKHDPYTLAAAAYLLALPPLTRVVLYWS